MTLPGESGENRGGPGGMKSPRWPETGRIAIVGAGSIGLFYGGRLAAQGHEVAFLLRSGYEEARREGLHIYSPDGDTHLTRPDVFQIPSEIGPSDLVIVAVKTTSNAALLHLLPPLLGPETRILTLQNGLGNEEFLAGHFGPERILGGLCFVCLTRRSPASVDHAGHGTLSLGKFQRLPSSRTRTLAEAFRTGGIETHLVDDLAAERWRKLVWNVPFNGLAVVSGGMTTDRILADPDGLARCRALMEEIIGIARTLGHSIEPDYAGFQIERTRSMGAYRPSTLVDWQAGQAMEIEPIWGEPLRQAHALGLEVPELARLYDEIHGAASRIPTEMT